MVLKLSFCSDFEHKVSRSVQNFEVDAQAIFATDVSLWLRSSILVEIVKLGFVKIVKLGFVKIFKFKFCRNADVWLRF